MGLLCTVFTYDDFKVKNKIKIESNERQTKREKNQTLLKANEGKVVEIYNHS